MIIWLKHYRFFRRFGLYNTTTIWINAALLFVILFYVYPLKFLYTLSAEWESGEHILRPHASPRADRVVWSGGLFTQCPDRSAQLPGLAAPAGATTDRTRGDAHPFLYRGSLHYGRNWACSHAASLGPSRWTIREKRDGPICSWWRKGRSKSSWLAAEPVASGQRTISRRNRSIRRSASILA